MSKPDERLVEGVDYDHGDHDDRPWADDEDAEG